MVNNIVLDLNDLFWHFYNTVFSTITNIAFLQHRTFGRFTKPDTSTFWRYRTLWDFEDSKHFDLPDIWTFLQYQILQHFDGTGHYVILTIADTLTNRTFGRFYNTGNFDIAMILLTIPDTMYRQLLIFFVKFFLC